MRSKSSGQASFGLRLGQRVEFGSKAGAGAETEAEDSSDMPRR